MKNYKIRLAVSFFALITAVSAQAQKNRPVAGDCITLIEILQTDYSLIDDVDQRIERVIQDRKRVVSIVKNYVDAGYARPTAGTFSTQVNNSLNKRSELQVIKREIDYLNTMDITKYNTLVHDERNPQATKSAKAIQYVTALKEVSKIELKIFDLEIDALIVALGSNPYLKELLGKFKTKFAVVEKMEPDQYAAGYVGLSIQKSGPIIGGGALTFTQAIDGLSKFIVKRLKEELANQVFEKVKTQLSTSDFDEFRIVFPGTTEYLISIQPDQYARMYNTLREHIDEDINALPNNLPNIVDAPRVAALLKKEPELAFALEGLKIINQIQTVENPLEVLFVIENSALIQKWSADSRNAQLMNLGNSMKLISLMVNSIMIQETGNSTLISLDSWKSHAGNIDFYAFYVGLLLQQDLLYYDIKFNIGTTTKDFSTILTQFHSNSVTYKFDSLHAKFGKPLENLLYEAESVAQQINELRRLKRQGGKIGGDSLISVLANTVNVIQKTGYLAADFLDMANSTKNTTAFRAKFDQYIYFSRQGVNIYKYILHKSYVEATTTAWITFMSITKYPLTKQTTEQVIKITDFLVSSAKAESADDFADAIENFALPAGSSSIKRKSKFNLALNTYPGFFFSGERLIGIRSDKPDTLWAFNTSITVPIGLAASWGKNDHAFTIFASVIDIGAFTSFRFKDDESVLPEITFENIFAPGVHCIYGFPNTPFSVGIGAQYGPLTREIKMEQDGATKGVDVSSYRIGLTFTFDIPLFNIYTRAK